MLHYWSRCAPYLAQEVVRPDQILVEHSQQQDGVQRQHSADKSVLVPHGPQGVVDDLGAVDRSRVAAVYH